MGNIEVAAGNNRLFGIEAGKIISIKSVPLLALSQALKTIARVCSCLVSFISGFWLF